MKAFVNIVFGLSLLGMGLCAWAAGMQPETSVVLINASDAMTPFDLTNTEQTPLLLYTKVLTLPEDKAPLVVASPTVVRVEPGRVQTVNFMLSSPTPLTQQRLRRVTFVGIPPAAAAKSVSVRFNVQQNLAMIISPANLKPNYQPWKLLQWSTQNTTLSVHNPSPYVVRLMPLINVADGQLIAQLPQSYILPGETLSTDLLTPQNKPIKAGTKLLSLAVSFTPATLYARPAEVYHSALLEQAPPPSHLQLPADASTPSVVSPSLAQVSASAPTQTKPLVKPPVAPSHSG